LESEFILSCILDIDKIEKEFMLGYKLYAIIQHPSKNYKYWNKIVVKGLIANIHVRFLPKT